MLSDILKIILGEQGRFKKLSLVSPYASTASAPLYTPDLLRLIDHADDKNIL